MKICVLASGSKCNCTYLETSNHKILIDMGTSLKSTIEKLGQIGQKLDEIDSIFITHSHGDHVNGIEQYNKRYKGKIYLTEIMYKELGIELKNHEFINEDFKLDEIDIEIIKLSHDTEDTNGYIFTENKKSLVYITDTGYINKKNLNKIINKNVYIMESNHDVEMLMTGKYQYHTKIRIVGDKGHLSNQDSARYLSKIVGEKTKYILLAHLSNENNTKEKALTTLNDSLSGANKNVNRIIVTSQDEISEMVEI